MSLGALHMRFDASDFRFQGVDPLLEFVDGQRIEILFRQRDERIIGFTWKEFVQVHGQNR